MRNQQNSNQVKANKKALMITVTVAGAALSFKAGMYYQSQRPVPLETVAHLAQTERIRPGTQSVCEAIAYDAVLWHKLSNREYITDQDAPMAYSRCGKKTPLGQ